KLRADLIRQRRAAAEQVIMTPAGKDFVYFLLEDMRFFDAIVTDAEIAIHNFARDMLENYFGVMVNNRDHRSLLTEAILGAWKPYKESIDE
ncbi:MAG: hypothetical protein ABIJ57_01245, partial [Pseudomonadota bacterium]